MSEEKKNEVTKEVKEETRELSMEELEQVTGGNAGGGVFEQGSNVQFKEEENNHNYHNHVYFINTDKNFKAFPQ